MTTVCRAIAEEVNKGAAPQDKITPGAIRNRVRAKELGRDKSLSGHSDQMSDESEQEDQPEMQAPMTTVCRALADDINKDAAPQDKVNGEQLRGRVRDKEGTLKRYNVPNEQEPTEKEGQPEMQPAAEKPAAGPHLLQWR